MMRRGGGIVGRASRSFGMLLSLVYSATLSRSATAGEVEVGRRRKSSEEMSLCFFVLGACRCNLGIVGSSHCLCRTLQREKLDLLLLVFPVGFSSPILLLYFDFEGPG